MIACPTLKVFKPDVRILGSFVPTATLDELDAEQSVYAASPEFVRANCGPIANSILDAVPDSYLQRCRSLGMLPNIDVRVHRLNRGEYPAVPGWHCDGHLRETYFGAPQTDRIPIRDTILATVSSHVDGVSNFEMLDESVEMEITPGQSDLWAQVHSFVESGGYRRLKSMDGLLYQMGIDTIHRCTPALRRGWRLLFRMSMWHNDYLGDGGKVARQQQVYIKSELGW
jgi:hypothetical protein